MDSTHSFSTVSVLQWTASIKPICILLFSIIKNIVWSTELLPNYTGLQGHLVLFTNRGAHILLWNPTALFNSTISLWTNESIETNTCGSAVLFQRVQTTAIEGQAITVPRVSSSNSIAHQSAVPTICFGLYHSSISKVLFSQTTINL